MLASLLIAGLITPVALAQADPTSAAADPDAVVVAITAPPPDVLVDLVYTGNLQGIGAGDYVFSMVGELWRAADALDGHLAELSVSHGSAARGPWTLMARDRRAGTVVAALQAGDLSCGLAQVRPSVSTRTEQLVMAQPGDSSLLDALADRGLPVEEVGMRSCSSPAAGELILVGPGEGQPDSWTLEDWELRRALVGRWADEDPARDFVVAAAPVQEASRLYTEARRLLAEREGAIFVDAGSFLDGVSSARNDRLSLHRPLTWRMLEALKPSALVPGETELALGAKGFFAELRDHDLPYLASNWQAPAELELPDHRVVEVAGSDGPVRVAFLGVLDPELHTWLPQLEEEGVEITDPVTATQDIVDALYASEDPPDAIVLLTTASGDILALLRRRVRGVDLLLGDPTFATFRVRTRDVDLRALPPGDKGAPVTLSLDGLASATLRFGPDGALDAVRSTPHIIGPTLPIDPEVTAAITRTRAEVYPPLDLPLVPAAIKDKPAEAWDAAGWSTVVCQALRDSADADAVLLRELPAPTRIPGPISELLAVEYVAMLDRVELHRIPGDSFKTVLNKAYGVVPVACGAELGAADPQAWGRSVEAGRTYRVVTTDRTRAATALGEILDGAPADGPLDPGGVTVLRGAAGNPWTIRAATLQSLRHLRQGQADPDQAVWDFLANAATAKPPEWLFRLRQLSVSVSRFQGADQVAFAAVPETLATSPSSFTLASGADLAVEYSDPEVVWDLRYRSTFASLATAGTETLETADDWRASTSVEVPGLAVPALLTWSPYSELLYDSEFTPTVDDTGAKNPGQADLSLALGLSAASSGPLTELRLGGFASRDLAQLDTKPTEWGGKAELGTSVALGFLSWTTDTEGQLFANTAADDASDLRFKVLAQTKLAAPLARWLSLGVNAQGFLLQGREPETDMVGGSWTLGASLDAAGVFEL